MRERFRTRHVLDAFIEWSWAAGDWRVGYQAAEREIFIDNLLVPIHCIIVMIRWTGLAPWEFEFPFPGSLISTFLERLT